VTDVERLGGACLSRHERAAVWRTWQVQESIASRATRAEEPAVSN
jgi:hypothetical protein